MTDLSSCMQKTPVSFIGCAPLVRSEPCHTASPVPRDVSLLDPNGKRCYLVLWLHHLYFMGTSALGMGKVEVNKNCYENFSTGKILTPSTGLGLPAAIAFMTK